MEDLKVENVGKLRVVQLRAHLKSVGLPVDGRKAELVKRLKEYITTSAADGDKAAASPKSRKRKTTADDGEDDTAAAPAAAAAASDDTGGDTKRQRTRSPASGKDNGTNGSGTAAAATASSAGGGAGGGAGASSGAGDAAADDDSSSDDDFGPMPSAAAAPAKPARKQRKPLAHEKVYLDQLPSSAMYEKSYMHRDRVTHIVVARKTDFIITASVDGHVKFWKKLSDGIEFVKHYKAHLEKLNGMAVSSDGLRLATTSADNSLKFYDVANFDMTLMVELTQEPGCCVWTYRSGSSKTLVAVADVATPTIRLYHSEQGDGVPVAVLSSIHSSPVTTMGYNERCHTVVSSDAKGMLEYWSVSTRKWPQKNLSFKYRGETDLLALAKAKTAATSIAFSRDGSAFVVTSRDAQVRVFKYRSGKLRRVYDESIPVFEESLREGKLAVDSFDFGRRVALEKELASSTTAPPSNAVFDESGHFIMYPTLVGIKIVNIETNKVVRVLGKVENTERFVNLALYQGVPKVDSQVEVGRKKKKPMLMSDGGGDGGGSTGPKHDPTIICTAFKRHRFYLFSQREPEDSEEGRDVFNEKPTLDDQEVEIEGAKQAALGREAVLHTTMGDITIKLFADECPRTVENFSVHSRNGYYNGILFHRVIKKFMIQTGDPLGNGTGGESIWGGEFEDEFHRNLRHDRPFTVSMANAGPGTNGSQFFITTVACPWLDNKHTVFGRVVAGMDTCTMIENAKADHTDKPFDDIKIVNIDIKH